MIKKFYASTTREALRQVRDALGPDAIILSNRQVAGGIEIMAVADMDVASLSAIPAAPAPQPPAAQFVPPPMSGTTPPPAPARRPGEQDETPAVVRYQREGRARASASEPAAKTPTETPRNGTDKSPENGMTQELFKEIRFLRSMLEEQLAGFAWSDMQRRDPVKIEVLRRMLTTGFSASLAHQLVDRIPPGCDAERAHKWIRAALVHNLRCVTEGEDIVEKGGVYALVGPTGVGKTTTVAKLAARCTLRHGANKLALLTTDSYRIGAHDQLRIYGRILGVPVYAVKDEADLELTLADLQKKHLVLIDTVGMSQRDKRLAQQIAMLCGDGKEVRRLLLISATSQGPTLEDVIRSYQGEGLEGVILTKIDEALSIGSALDVVIRHRLPIHFVTNGQRVPEDLHLANALYLMDRAFKGTDDGSPFTLKEEDCPLVYAGGWQPADGEPNTYERPSNRDGGGYRG